MFDLPIDSNIIVIGAGPTGLLGGVCLKRAGIQSIIGDSHCTGVERALAPPALHQAQRGASVAGSARERRSAQNARRKP